MIVNSLAGRLLLATPSLQDRNFKDAVVLLCHHDAEGSMGLIINRPQEVLVRDVLEDLDLKPNDAFLAMLPEHRLHSYEGGPVDPFRGFVLHDSWHMYESTMQVTPELHLSTSRDVLEEIARGTGPEHFLLVLGYAGWDAGQLEQELAENDWLIANVNHHLVFEAPPEHRWALGARSMGIDKAQLTSQIGHA